MKYRIVVVDVNNRHWESVSQDEYPNNLSRIKEMINFQMWIREDALNEPVKVHFNTDNIVAVLIYTDKE